MENKKIFVEGSNNFNIKKIQNSKKNKIKLSLIIIILMFLILGSTYALYNSTFFSNQYSIQTGTVSIEYLESTEVITVYNSLPISDNEGKNQSETYDFNVITEAKGNISLTYNLYIEKLEIEPSFSPLNGSQIKFYLTDESDNALIEPTKISSLEDPFYSKTNNHSRTNTRIENNYKIRVWIDQDVHVGGWENVNFQYKFKIGAKIGDNSEGDEKLILNNTIPEGAYYLSVATGEIAETIPETPSEEDVLLYGDYMYVYSTEMFGGWGVYSLVTSEVNDAMGITAMFPNYLITDKNQTEYDPIVESINGHPIVYIGNLFEGCSKMTVAPKLPSGITSLEKTFLGCSSLKIAPKIPDNVTNMNLTFGMCSSLIEAPVIPSKVTNMEGTFAGCTSLVNGPDMSKAASVTNMKETFNGCKSLLNAPVIPKSVTNMEGTFTSCTSLKKAPAIPSKVTNLNQTFSECSSLEIPPDLSNATSVTSMGYTFLECGRLEAPPVIPNSVKKMNQTFVMSGLKVAPTIPNGVTELFATFMNCRSLATAPVIPASVTNMKQTFLNTSSLIGNVEINANPSSYDGAFGGTEKPIKITGSSSTSTKAAIAATANNGNVSY